MSALLLKDGEFVACVYRGLVEDFAQRSVRSIAQKVIKSARKKFSKLIIKINEREVSAWDYYCLGLVKDHSAFRDKFVSDFIQLAVLRRVDGLGEEKRRLLELSACEFHEIDRNTILRRETVLEWVQSDIRKLVIAHGLSVRQCAIDSDQDTIPVFSPDLSATALVHHSSMNGASP